MEKILYRKTLDVHKNGTQFLLQGFETADKLSRVVEISLMQSGDAIDFPLEKIIAIMYVTTPGATEPSIYNCTIKDNKVVFKVPQITVEGITTIQLKLIETSTDGARSVLASPKFACEVIKSNMDDESIEQGEEFTRFEDAVALAKSVYDERFLRMELSSDCLLRAFYADGTMYETDVLKQMFHEGNSILSESFAHGGTGVRTGEDTDNSQYYSNVAKSESLNAQAIMEGSKDILEEVKLHGVYTAFNINFETGEVEYVSPSFSFKVNAETGELDAEGQSFTFEDEIGRVVEEWLGAHSITLNDLQKISGVHSDDIAELQILTEAHTEEIAEIKETTKLATFSSYLAFVSNVNADMVSAAFGKGNEDEILGIGKALAMYANFKSETGDFSNLEECKSLSEIRNNPRALDELLSCGTLLGFVKSNKYSYEQLRFFENPAMTSNSAPSGVASASSVFSNYGNYTVRAYNAFNHGGTTWISEEGISHWLKYDFGYEVRPYKMIFSGGLFDNSIGQVILQGSTDDVTYENITEQFTVSSTADHVFSLGFSEKKYRYFRAVFTMNTTRSRASCSEWEIHCIDV